MPGSIVYTPQSSGLDLGAYDPVVMLRLGSKGYELLPHVRAVSDSVREGPEPGSAQCYFVFDDVLSQSIGSPTRIEEVWGFSAYAGNWRVLVDDRIVLAQLVPPPPSKPPSTPATIKVLFAGFAANPQADLGDGTERVTFAVLGQPVREWDTPLPGAIYRNAHSAEDAGDWNPERKLNEYDQPTDLPTRFNPDGLPNATMADADSGEDPGGTKSYPVFIDPLVIRTPDVRRPWTVAMAARYILQVGNPTQRWVKHDEVLWQIDGLLKVRVPSEDGGAIDPKDPDSFEWADVLCQDLDVTGKSWPEALRALLEPHGWTFTWRLSTGKDPEDPHDPDATDRPVYQLDIYRKDDPPASRTVGLQRAGNVLDPAKTNLAAAGLSFDTSRVVNAFTVDTSPVLYEVSVVLAPLFPIDPADAAYPTRKRYARPSGEYSHRRDYRWFGLDETGDGHWDFAKNKWLNAAATSPDADSLDQFAALIKSLSKLFVDVGSVEDPAWDANDVKQRFAVRRRPGRRELLTRDTATGEPLSAKLQLVEASKYPGAVPGLFDPAALDKGGGTLQEVQQGGWDLLPDRLGIALTCEDPNGWEVGEPKAVIGGIPKIVPGSPFGPGKVNVVQCLATPGASGQPYIKLFHLVLTCVIAGDRGIQAKAIRRKGSPGTYPITRRDDARDRYQRAVVDPSSVHSESGSQVASRDDTKVAERHASARRTAHESATLAGRLTVNRLVRSVRIGDAVTAISGRGISLRTVAGAAGAEGPRYPVVVGIDRSYTPRLATTFHLQDRRTEGVALGHEAGLVGNRRVAKIKAAGEAIEGGYA